MALLLVLYLIYSVSWAADYLSGTVMYDSASDTYHIKLNTTSYPNGVAFGYFNDSLNETGWSVLEIETSNNDKSKTDYNRMYASGYLEGYLSCREIYYSYLVQWEGMKNIFIPFKNDLQEWIDNQRQWIDNQINNNKNDQYWQYVNGLTAQFDGQIKGYNDAINDNLNNYNLPILSEWDFHFIVGNSDLIDVIEAIVFKSDFDSDSDIKSYKEILSEYKRKSQHCSGYVHVSPLLDNIYFSHSTWWSYYCTNRVFKHYKFNLLSKYPTTHLSMSSFPGALSSTDDYYQMNSGLIVMETTNGLYNEQLWSLLKPETLFTWQRARIANALADTSLNWINIFTKYNSGTYNNQWIILNYNLFKPNEPLIDNGLLMICEQIPGNISFMDVTNILERGYFGSYNIPAIEYIYKESGNEEYAKLNGPSASYDLAPRSRIFRRDGNNVFNMSDAMKLMRYNNYLNDNIEQNNSMWAIMSRGDLTINNKGCFGGIDTKIADYNMMKNMETYAMNGPTNDNLPTFEWSGEWENNPKCPHTALPKKYNFTWINMKSILNKP